MFEGGGGVKTLDLQSIKYSIVVWKNSLDWDFFSSNSVKNTYF